MKYVHYTLAWLLLGIVLVGLVIPPLFAQGWIGTVIDLVIVWVYLALTYYLGRALLRKILTRKPS